MLCAFSGQGEATLKGTVGQIATLIIPVCATLFRIAQGRSQPCDPPRRNDVERYTVHLIPSMDPSSPTMQSRKSLHSRFL